MSRYIAIEGCKKCPHRHYYSVGLYECLKYGTVLPASHILDIPEWCPLPKLPTPASAQETLADRQREPDAVEKQALYGNLRKLYRRDVPDETLDHSKPECPNTHAGKHIPGESYKVCWYCQL